MTDQIRTLQGRVVSDKMEKSMVVGEAPYLREIHPSYDEVACT